MTHPGSLVRQECLDPNGLTVTDAAQVIRCNRQTLSNLLNGRSGISPEMALRLEGLRHLRPLLVGTTDELRTGSDHGARA